MTSSERRRVAHQQRKLIDQSGIGTVRKQGSEQRVFPRRPTVDLSTADSGSMGEAGSCIRLVLVSACDTAGRCLKSNLDPRQGTAMRTPVWRTTMCISSAIANGRDVFRVAANSQPSRIGAGFRRNV
jgi:hypothetical protein